MWRTDARPSRQWARPYAGTDNAGGRNVVATVADGPGFGRIQASGAARSLRDLSLSRPETVIRLVVPHTVEDLSEAPSAVILLDSPAD
jgi:hypothetical protein